MGEKQLPDAVGCCQDPVLFYQRPSAGVTPLAAGAVLQGDLGRSTGDPTAERAGPSALQHPSPGSGGRGS